MTSVDPSCVNWLQSNFANELGDHQCELKGVNNFTIETMSKEQFSIQTHHTG